MLFDLQPFLNGDMVALRPLKEEDREALFVVAADPLLWEQHPQKDRYRRPVFDAFFDGMIQSKSALLALNAESQQILGTSKYYDWDPAAKSIFIGSTFLSRLCWGQGYNREMKKLMLDHVFNFADTVFFDVAINNHRSRQAMAKIGGEVVAEREKTLGDGSLYPHVIYRISKEKGLQ